ncbi:adenylyltransferase/cytidyltransferase family protein [Pseudonocardia sp. TRM90224]|uniref:adenylyltransferase/cytidyltransferase family protein n=1 Tax=Pseudonocardia sp. TRM90224 TaxID=2812678 RepID=UPI001E5EA113|nr:adenylyltransferase/cytidyltransferase family protein [Pseudonocardia sp. TRM90224]
MPVWYGLDAVPADLGASVVTIGVFDGLHRGHRRLIEHARTVADERRLPLVLVTFDPHPARVLGIPRDTAALTTVEHRAELAGAAGVDAVCVLRFTRELAALSPETFVRQVLVGALGAAAVVVGANFTFGAKAAGDVAALHRLGTELGFAAHGVPLLQVVDAPCSSTYTRRCLRDGDLDAVARALGRPHRIDGHRSGELIEVAAGTALPPPGRYAATVAGRPATLEVTGAQELRVVAGRRVGKGPVAVTLHGRA